MTDSVNAVDRSAAKPGKTRERWPRRLFGWFCWLYLFLLLALWYVIRHYGDRWWLATLILFGPRWLAALPVALLIPLAAFIRRRSFPALLLAAFVAVFLVGGFCVPWRRATEPAANGTPLRVLTFNTHDDAVDVPALTQFIRESHVDVVALEERWGDTEQDVFEPGWYVQRADEIILASRYPISDVTDVGIIDHWNSGKIMRARLAIPGGDVYVIALHLRSPHASFRSAVHGSANGERAVEHNISDRNRGAELLREGMAGLPGPVILMGDFNLPAESPIFRNNLGQLGDAFNGGGWGFGWTYRVRFTDTRIDHVLFDENWTCHHAWVGPDLGSPHRPLLADMMLVNKR